MRKYLASLKHLSVQQGRHVRRSAESGWVFWRTWVRSIYLPDGVNVYMDSFIRVVFCLYYLPSIVVALAVTHSALERVVWVLIVPVTQEMERNPYRFSSLRTLTAGLYSIAIQIAPFAALGIAFATVGHKAMNVCLEAMLDAYTTSHDKDYPLLHARLRFVLEKRSRIFTFVVVMVVLAVAVVYVFQQHTISFLSHDEPHVLLAAGVVATTQGLFVLWTVVSGAPKDVMEAFAGGLASAKGALSAASRSPMRGVVGRRKDGDAGGGAGSLEQQRRQSPTPPGSLRSCGDNAEGRAGETLHSERPLSPLRLSRHDQQKYHSNPLLELSSPGSTASSSNTLNGSLAALEGGAFDPPDVMAAALRFLEYFLGDWWTNTIFYMRHIGFVMALVFGVLVATGAGPIQGVTSAVLLIMCLNFPHLFGYVSLMVTFAVIRTTRSFRWLKRHPDVFLPVLVVDMPYQMVLLNALHYFRHHLATCALLLGVNVLLVARAIDLVWEYDVSETGSVHWEDANQECVSSQKTSPNVPSVREVGDVEPPTATNTNADTAPDTAYADSHRCPRSGGRAKPKPGKDARRSRKSRKGSGDNREVTMDGGLVKPSLAILLEDAYEKHHQRPGLVSLDIAIDIKHMRIRYAAGAKGDVLLTRHQIIPYGAGRRYLRDRSFYSYVLPRLLSLQSPGYFAGAQYRTARVLLRAISITALLVFTLIVFGMIVQAAFPQLRPIPVRVTTPADGSLLTIDHVVLHMNLLSAQSGSGGGGGGGGGGPDERPTRLKSAEGWADVMSAAGEDFYPRLCRRDYYGTTVWELSLLALAPYLFSDDDVNTLIAFMNRHLGSDWVIRRRRGSACVATDSAHAPTRWNGFYDFYSARRGTSVIAIRGTDMFSLKDFLIDINLFFEAVLYQIMTFVVPGAIVVPKELVVNLIHMVSLRGGDGDGDYSDDGAAAQSTWAALARSANSSLRRCQQNNYRRDFYADVQNHLTFVATRRRGGGGAAAEKEADADADEEVDALPPPEHVVVTGHSLGGAVAAIVASRMELEAVAFSAPAIALSRKKFGVGLRTIHKHVMTVISTNDIVPALGGDHGGESHHLECLAARREMCHAMEFMVGSLWRSCSSVRERFPAIVDVV